MERGRQGHDHSGLPALPQRGHVDLDDEGHGTYKRYRKDSFYYYKKLIAANGNVDAVEE